MAEHTAPHHPEGSVGTLPKPDLDKETFDAMMAGADLASHPDGDFNATPDRSTDPNTALAETRDGKFRIVMVGLDRNIRSHGMEEANRVLNEKTKGEGMVGLIKNAFTGRFKEVPRNIAQAFRQVVHGNIAREAVLNKEYLEARDRIIRNQNLLVNQGGEIDDYRLATLYRFGEAADEYEELIQKADNEKRIKIDLKEPADGEEKEDDSVGGKMRNAIRSLMERAAAGEFDDTSGALNKAAFDEEVKAMMVELVNDPSNDAKDYLGQGLVQVSNLYEILMAMRARFSVMQAKNPDADFNDILNNTELYLGEGRVGAYTETGRTMTERAMDLLGRTPFLNESSVASAVSVALAAGAWFTKRTLSGAATVYGALGAGAAVIGSLRAMNATRLNRAFQGRRAEMGILDDNPEVLETLYKMKEATELTDQLGLLYTKEGEFRMDDPTASMQLIAEAAARLRLSARRGKGFIRTTEQEGGPKRAEQMLNLTIALSKAKVDLRKVIEEAIAAGDDDVLRNFGILDERLTEVKDADDPLEAVLEPVIAGNEGMLSIDVMGEINDDIAEKDRAHRKLMLSKGWKTALISGLSALTFGIVTQEAAAAWFERQQGLFGGKKGQSETMLHRHIGDSIRAFKSFFGIDGGEPTITATTPDGEHILGQTKINTQEGVNVAQSPDGSFSVSGPDGAKVEGVSFTATGNLTDESLKNLNAKGFHIGTSNPEYVTPPAGPPIEKQVNGTEFVEKNKDKMVQVKRHWMLNEKQGPNGEKPYYDKNELKLYNPHLQPDGRIQISIRDMTRQGSYNGKYHVDWHNANMKMAFTVNNGTSDRVMWVDIDKNGNAYIDKNQDPDLYGMFKPSGRSDPTEMRFQGKWTQPVNDRGPDANGVHRVDVLATDIGANTNNFTTAITPEPEPIPVTPYTITYTPPNEPLPPVVVTPIVPIYARRGLNTGPRTPRAPGAPAPAATPPTAPGGSIAPPPFNPSRTPTTPFTPPRQRPPRNPGTPPPDSTPYFTPTPEQERAATFGLPSAESVTPPTGATPPPPTDAGAGTGANGQAGLAPGSDTGTAGQPGSAPESNDTSQPGAQPSDDSQPAGTPPTGATPPSASPPNTDSLNEFMAGVRASQEAREAQQRREEEAARREAEANANARRATQEAIDAANRLLRGSASEYPFLLPYNVPRPSREVLAVLRRAIDLVITEHPELSSAGMRQTYREEGIRAYKNALKRLHRQVTRKIHPDNFQQYIPARFKPALDIITEASKFWHMDENSAARLELR